jgi:hypothetical protein
VLTGLATATFPDGSTPEVIDVVGWPRTCSPRARRPPCACSRRHAADRRAARPPEAAAGDSSRILNFVEECLRYESPVKGDFRLARVATKVGGVEIPAGTTLMVLNGAANRDPRRFERPTEFWIDRPNAREHLAFGQGPHTCPGAPLARARPASASSASSSAWPTSGSRTRARTRRRAPLRVRADLHPARSTEAPHRVHPVGLTGWIGFFRRRQQLVHELRRRGGGTGVATMCAWSAGRPRSARRACAGDESLRRREP